MINLKASIVKLEKSPDTEKFIDQLSWNLLARLPAPFGPRKNPRESRFFDAIKNIINDTLYEMLTKQKESE